MLTIEIFKNEINAIWYDEKFQTLPFIDRGYGIQSVIPFNSILFIGINPSFDEKKNKDYESLFYNVHLDDSHRYFKKFKDIGEKNATQMSHFDLLFLKETNQNNIKNLYNSLIGREFLDEQLLVSKKVIENSKPKIIVISNAFARDLFLKEGIFQTEFDSQLGTHKIINNENLAGIPVFFTSMLTGQRALDNGSYERLIWHINQLLK